MISRLAAVAAVAAALLFVGAPVGADMPTDDDIAVAKSAIDAIEAENWGKAQTFTSRIKDPLALKLVRWLTYAGQKSGATFHQISSFMSQSQGWPKLKLLQQRAEEAIDDKIPDGELISWFKKNPPVSIDGQVRSGAALFNSGESEKGRDILRNAWVNGNFSKSQEKAFYRRYRRLLTGEDHVARLDRLLWEERKSSAQRMILKVAPSYRALGEARLMLSHRLGNVDKAIARVPGELKNDPGLVFERMRWRRQKGQEEAALELLAKLPDSLPYPVKWWKERALLARDALQKGHISEAYRIAKDHRLTEGAGFAEAEWLAGWIALRFLNDYAVAKNHFIAMYKAVKSPVSRSRGAYWTARAAEAMKDAPTAEQWYQIAAGNPTTYHGQLAVDRTKPAQGKIMIREPEIKAADMVAFNKHELTRVLRMLKTMGKDDAMGAFVKKLGDHNDAPGWRSMTASLANSLGRPDLAINVSKGSHEMIRAGYPTLIPPGVNKASGKDAVEVPLVLAMVRQESAFYTKARSRAGALGLMQIMPRTAENTAKMLKVSYSPRRLNSDPDYNLTLGQFYLADLLKEFDGSYILALAAYNAGPARARKWVHNNGDPRTAAVDPIDWIEMIPFDETRDYVQRVLENLQVYRLHLAETEVALTLESDLKR